MADKTINKIYHLADLHIRNLKRHKEYREVFNKFLKRVKKDNIEDYGVDDFAIKYYTSAKKLKMKMRI